MASVGAVVDGVVYFHCKFVVLVGRLKMLYMLLRRQLSCEANHSMSWVLGWRSKTSFMH